MPCNCKDLIIQTARKAESAARTIASDDANDATFKARQETCGQCPERSTKIREHYCDACGCRRTYWARLRYKNRKKGWECPKGRFGRVT